MTELARPELLTRHHEVDAFDCGEEALNRWLVEHALAANRAETAKTYVAHRNGDVRGYYSLAAGGASPKSVPARVASGGGGHPVPVTILARLVVDQREQHRGIGRGLVKDALLKIAAAADIIGVRAVLVHMKDPSLRPFYEQFDFEPSPVDDEQMYLLMKDLRRALLSDRAPAGT